jgi:hypothetical protein
VVSTTLAFALPGGDFFLLISEEKIANIFNGLEQGAGFTGCLVFSSTVLYSAIMKSGLSAVHGCCKGLRFTRTIRLARDLELWLTS